MDPNAILHHMNLLFDLHCDSSNQCRICHQNPEFGHLIAPCHCTGTDKWAHPRCLKQLMEFTCTKSCSVCHFEYSIIAQKETFEVDSIFSFAKSQLNEEDFTFRKWMCRFVGFAMLIALMFLSVNDLVVAPLIHVFKDENDEKGVERFEPFDFIFWSFLFTCHMIKDFLLNYLFFKNTNSAFTEFMRRWRVWQELTFVVDIIPCAGHPDVLDFENFQNDPENDFNAPHRTIDPMLKRRWPIFHQMDDGLSYASDSFPVAESKSRKVKTRRQLSICSNNNEMFSKSETICQNENSK